MKRLLVVIGAINLALWALLFWTFYHFATTGDIGRALFMGVVLICIQISDASSRIARAIKANGTKSATRPITVWHR